MLAKPTGMYRQSWSSGDSGRTWWDDTGQQKFTTVGEGGHFWTSNCVPSSTSKWKINYFVAPDLQHSWPLYVIFVIVTGDVEMSLSFRILSKMGKLESVCNKDIWCALATDHQCRQVFYGFLDRHNISYSTTSIDTIICHVQHRTTVEFQLVQNGGLETSFWC